MRLADAMIAAQGSDNHRYVGGALSSVARVLVKAERFELADEVAEAYRHVAHSKPSSILSALPVCRLPYSRMWLEWQGHPEAPGADPECPARIGCLIEAATEQWLDRATMTWVWIHPQAELRPLMVGPIGCCFDWSIDGDVVGSVVKLAQALAAMPADKAAELSEQGRRFYGNGFSVDSWAKHMLDLGHAYQPSLTEVQHAMVGTASRWRRVAGDPKEQAAARQLVDHQIFMPSPHCLEFLRQAALSGVVEGPQWPGMMQSWHRDVTGEYAFAHAFICLLNARQGLTQTREDLGRLNAKRQRVGKRPLCEFITTRLTLSRGIANRGAAQGMSREATRRHLVRGHFKLRRSGVFWWSPFVRGHGETVRRDHYSVRPGATDV